MRIYTNCVLDNGVYFSRCEPLAECSITDRHREAIALLDAAANENGAAFIEGVGDCRTRQMKKDGQPWRSYWLDEAWS